MSGIEKQLDEFERASLREFDFLCSMFAFQISKKERDSYGMYVTYVNKTTGVRVSFEPREGGIFVLLSRLLNGSVPPYPIVIGPKTVLHSFHLDDLCKVRAPDRKFPRYRLSSPGGIQAFTTELSTLLKDLAPDVLSGNFRVFQDIEGIVKARARHLAGQSGK